MIEPEDALSGLPQKKKNIHKPSASDSNVIVKKSNNEGYYSTLGKKEIKDLNNNNNNSIIDNKTEGKSAFYNPAKLSKPELKIIKQTLTGDEIILEDKVLKDMPYTTKAVKSILNFNKDLDMGDVYLEFGGLFKNLKKIKFSLMNI